MKLVEKIILEQQKEKGLINYIEDYELIYWLENNKKLKPENDILIKKLIRRDKLSYAEEIRVNKLISTEKIDNIVFNEFSIKSLNKYNMGERLKPYENNHLQRFIEKGELQLINNKLIPSDSWKKREEILYREKESKIILPKEIIKIREQLKDFIYLEEKQIINNIYKGDDNLYLSDKKILDKSKSIENINIIRGKIKLNRNSKDYLSFKQLKKIKLKRYYASFEYTDKEIESLSEREQRIILNLIKLTEENGYLEKVVVYKKRNKEKINLAEFNHDRYIYDAYCHAKQNIEENGGNIKRILNERQQKKELYTGNTNTQPVKHPDLVIIYEDKNKTNKTLNLEIAINYKPLYIKEKANNFNQLNWYCIDRNQHKVIKENTPNNHEVYLLPRRW